jgi:hypothetical protein
MIHSNSANVTRRGFLAQTAAVAEYLSGLLG